jgi:hypothetical protein
VPRLVRRRWWQHNEGLVGELNCLQPGVQEAAQGVPVVEVDEQAANSDRDLPVSRPRWRGAGLDADVLLTVYDGLERDTADWLGSKVLAGLGRC